MNEGQLMGDFESESKQLEAESWSRVVDSKFLKQQKKDAVKRQEVIYGEILPWPCGTGCARARGCCGLIHWAVESQFSSVASQRFSFKTLRYRDMIFSLALFLSLKLFSLILLAIFFNMSAY